MLTSAGILPEDSDLNIGVLGNMGPQIHLQMLLRDRFIGIVRKDYPLLAQTTDASRYIRNIALSHVVTSHRGRMHGLWMKR